MKFKLFLISIFVLICFVAYQKYTEYSSLKSINSYDSCITAKGSIIQESYPATCITRLGSRFVQPKNISWKDYSGGKYNFRISYPSNWIVSSPDPSGDFETSGTLNFYDENKSPIVQASLNVMKRSGTSFPLQVKTIMNYDWKEKNKSEYQLAGIVATKISGISNNAIGEHMQSAVLFENGEYIYVFHSIGLYDLNLFNQILSTFKFTD